MNRSKSLNKESWARTARRRSRLIYPRPPLLRNFTKEICQFKVKSSKSKPSDGDWISATRGLNADVFFGASPVVASALDLRVGRDPVADQIDNNMRSVFDQVKAEVSTLQKTGRFYFALTPVQMELTWPGPMRKMILSNGVGLAVLNRESPPI